MPAEPAYVIVGASLAGAKAAETLRDEGFSGSVVLIGDERHRPYERPPLSKGLLLGKDNESSVYVHDEGWYAEHDIDLRPGGRGSRPGPSTGPPGGWRWRTAARCPTTSC
jgi:3-phenylpropionate/trans-cinnamate dioxygenase ferredoxin reductase subunit